MRIFAVVVAAALSVGLSGAVRAGTATESGRVIRDVPYSQDGNLMHLGDLYLPEKVMPGLSGHCIWIPKSKPRRLIPAVEKAISDFVRP